MGIHKSFFEGRNPLNVPMDSIDNIDWYNEQIERCFEGYSKNGYRITGDHYHFLNFFPIQRSVLDRYGNPTDKFTFDYPFWSQEDDYLFKQIEEAQCQGDKKAIFLFTGRGYGKTYIVLSIGSKLYHFIDTFYGIICASGDDHAGPTWLKLQQALHGIDKLHPSIRLKRLKDNEDVIHAGEVIYSEGERIIEEGPLFEKKLYDKKPGKTKGRRLDFQHFEEVGDWGGAAPLKDCISASEGSWKVGSIKRCRVFYTGTGGTVLSNQAKELFENPDIYDIYAVREWGDRRTGIVIPAYKKYGGYYEKTGISDIEGAKAELLRIRKEKEADPKAYNLFVQEYPFNPEEMFMLKGTNNFNQELLAKQYVNITNKPEYQLGEYGNLHWKRLRGKIIGVEWETHKDGKMWRLEEPETDENGSIYNNLYVGGYDGIDLGSEDTSSGKGSQGALAIKKRFLSTQKTNNIYTFFYHERPKDINDFYENVLKSCWYWNLSGKNENGDITGSLNIEFSKIGIVGFFKEMKQLRWFMKRPRLTLADPSSDKESRLIGTLPTVKNFENAEMFLARYIKDYWNHLFYLPAINQLKDFSMENRTLFDIVIAMMMCELGDDEFSDRIVVRNKRIDPPPQFGFYTDSNGVKRWGKLPTAIPDQFNFKSNIEVPDFIESINQI